MKTYLVLILAVLLPVIVPAQSDSLGLPGDDLDLCGVLQLFKTSKSPDAFEKALNKKDNKVNNLDLNGDGKVDYLRVIDVSKADAHALAIRDDVSKTESQDVAVIEIEKKGAKDAQLQIVGDEELYGKNYIIEPKPDKTTDEGKWGGFAPDIVIVNVWYWPCVSYLWYPDYVVWVSPFYWGYYPSWWYPWEPMPYYMYYDEVYVYHDYYYWTDDYRCQEAHSVYQPRRVVSSTVHQRTAPSQQRVAERQRTSPQRATGGQRPVPGGKPTGARQTPRSNVPDKNVPPSPQRNTETPKQAPKENPAPQRNTETPKQTPPTPNRNTETPKQTPPAPNRNTETPRPVPPRQGPVINNPAPRPMPMPRPAPPRPSSQPMPRRPR